MLSNFDGAPESDDFPIIDLSQAPGKRDAWKRSSLIIYAWAMVELLFVTNPLQPSSALRVAVLRLFGAKIGEAVVFRPRTRVKFPWNLEVGDRSWIGEGVWFHNQDRIQIGADVVISQECFLTTGSHRFRTDMGLITKPIVVASGVWVTARCVVLGGAEIGQSAIISAMSVVQGRVAANSVMRDGVWHCNRFASEQSKDA
jgi:putative colanic acid biosynthesis acetyltransferase WcaF